MNKRLIVILFLLISFTHAQAQDVNHVEEFKAMNNYVEYLNKSVHGLFVVHKLLEIQNQEINKYVDLESYDMYNISNSDVSSNVFTENTFYEKKGTRSPRNPYELARIAKESGSLLDLSVQNSWNDKTVEIKSILEETNQIRYDMENYLTKHDLNERSEIYGAYEILERAKDLFFKFYTLQLDFYRNIDKYSKSKNVSFKGQDLLVTMRKVHEASRLILDALRFKNDNSFKDLFDNLLAAYDDYKRVSKVYIKDHNFMIKGISKNLINIDKRINDVINSARSFMESATVPTKYKQYGKYYHYHNNEIVSYMDWFGFGFINEMNTIINKLRVPAIQYLEIPLFFQVIYPMKLDTVNHIESTDPMIDKMPTTLKNREIIESNYTIQADSNVVVLKLFDHMIQDGDIVSINFNGDWLLENYSIENKAIDLNLKLNLSGKNYLLLHAENEGRRPPNTLGIRYTFNGELKEIELKSTLNTSELIEIINPK